MAYEDFGAYPGQESVVDFYNTTGTLSGSANILPFERGAGRVYIQIIGGNGAYMTFYGTASSSHYEIPPGGVFVYQGRPVRGVSLLGKGPGPNYSTYSVHAN